MKSTNSQEIQQVDEASTTSQGIQQVDDGETAEVNDSLLVGPDADVDPTVSVVMPTMNEEEGIGECIDLVKNAVRKSGYSTEVIISDASSDRTPEIARSKGAIVVEPDKPGYGYAYRYAFEHCRGQYIIIGDADTTYDFEQFPELLEPVVHGEADMMMGSRLEGEIKDGAMPALHQYVGNPLLTRMLNMLYGAGVSDAHSGFRAFEADILDELDLETTGMEFASEMIMEAGAQDLTIKETPITYHEREGEATLESFRDGWRHVRFMMLNAPTYTFALPGALLSVLGISMVVSGAAGMSIGGFSLGINSTIAGSLLFLVGYQAINMQTFTTVASDPIQRPDDIVTETFVERLSLERLSAIGVALFTLGSAYVGWSLFQAAFNGLTLTTAATTIIVALIAIVVGMQTVFNAFLITGVKKSHT